MVVTRSYQILLPKNNFLPFSHWYLHCNPKKVPTWEGKVVEQKQKQFWNLWTKWNNLKPWRSWISKHKNHPNKPLKGRYSNIWFRQGRLCTKPSKRRKIAGRARVTSQRERETGSGRSLSGRVVGKPAGPLSHSLFRVRVGWGRVLRDKIQRHKNKYGTWLALGQSESWEELREFWESDSGATIDLACSGSNSWQK